MGSLLIRAFDARRQPLPDRMDVRVVQAEGRVVTDLRDLDGSADVQVVGVIDHQPYIVTVRSKRHRPVSQFAIPRPGAPVEVSLYAPLDAAKATATFPAYEGIDKVWQRLLEPSIYAQLNESEKAGLFNLCAKMDQCGAWLAIRRLVWIQRDRLLCEVSSDLLGFIASSKAYRAVSGKLHETPEGCTYVGSFKTLEPAGNLQLTFFKGEQAMLVDADIDDAAGLGHVFQVVGHWLTNGKTHPYDIHEILTFSQALILPYSLA